MPNRASTDEQVASRALVMIGAKPITSFGDGTTEASTAAIIYEDVITNVMTTTRWRFTVTQKRLNRLTTKPIGRWSASWQLPSDILQVVAVTAATSDKPVRFERYMNTVYTDDHNDLNLDYVRRVPVVDWPPYFLLPAVHQLASELAIAVAQNEQLSALHAQKYAALLAVGKTADAQGRTASVLDVKRYERARNG